MKTLPTLYKRTSTGKVQQWTVKIDGDSYWSESGQQGGKITKSKPKVAKPKNVGKSNETTPEEQALKEAQAKWDKKVERHYFEDIEEIDNKPFQVTLAHKSDDHAHKLEGQDVFLSPKLDGMRCYITKDGAFSRENNKLVTTKYIEEELEPFFEQFPEAILDGELYNHQFKDNFNEILSLARKTKLESITEESWEKVKANLQYHIFDVARIAHYDEATEYYTRMGYLKTYLKETDLVKFVETRFVVPFKLDLEDAQNRTTSYFKECLENGYEGTMIRLSSMPYEKKRSYNLLKLKNFETEEFEILDVIEGEGNRSGMFGKFVLALPDGRTFKANARGDYKFYKEIWENREDYIGKLATHRFMNYTPDGVPRGGAVIAIRDYE